MKKSFTLTALSGITLLLFTSCTKNYTCTCTYTTNKLVQSSVSDIPKSTKRQAEVQCNRESKAYNTGTGFTYVKCSI